MLLGIDSGAARGRASRIARSDLRRNTMRTNGIYNLSLLFLIHLLLKKLKALSDIVLIKWIIFLYCTSRLPFIVNVILRIVEHFPDIFIILLLAGSFVNC